MNETWTPFTHRYGLASFEYAAEWDGMAWRSRHRGENRSPESETFRCTCPGPLTVRNERCFERATQEDRLCDACREYCWASTDSGQRIRLVELSR